MSLKALADNVLHGTGSGTNGGTKAQLLSQRPIDLGHPVGTAEYEERAAIMQFDGRMSRAEAEAAAKADFLGR